MEPSRRTRLLRAVLALACAFALLGCLGFPSLRELASQAASREWRFNATGHGWNATNVTGMQWNRTYSTTAFPTPTPYPFDDSTGTFEAYPARAFAQALADCAGTGKFNATLWLVELDGSGGTAAALAAVGESGGFIALDGFPSQHRPRSLDARGTAVMTFYGRLERREEGNASRCWLEPDALKWVANATGAVPPAMPSPPPLVDYALQVINSDRAKYNLSFVRLGINPAAQAHADGLLANDAVSHWGSDGLKPYMRYSFAGGKWAVGENCAAVLCPSGDCNFPTPEKAVLDSEWAMMYDDAEVNWGHRDNIIGGLHNFVGIGVAYDGQGLTLTQEFEDAYIVWRKLEVRKAGGANTTVSLSGLLLAPFTSTQTILVFYDAPPKPLSAYDMRNTPRSYGLGNETALFSRKWWGEGDAPPAAVSIRAQVGTSGGQGNGTADQKGNASQAPPATPPLLYASKWMEPGDGTFDIELDLTPVIARNGPGIYTLGLYASKGTRSHMLTTYSVKVD